MTLKAQPMFNRCIEKIPTGIEPIDKLVGGQFSSCLHGLLTPTGLGRTQIGIMLAAAGARNAYYNKKITGITNSWWFFNAHEPAASIRASALAFLAEIPLDRAIEFTQITGGGAAPWEVEPSENIKRAVAIVSESLRVVNLEHLPCWKGFGPVDAIRQIVADLPVAGIVIDDIELLTAKYIAACKAVPETASAMIKGFVGRCKSSLATPLFVPVWLLHRLAGGRSQNPIHRLGHVDAAGTRFFGDYLDVSIVTGEKIWGSGNFPVRASKLLKSVPNLGNRLWQFRHEAWSIADVTPAPELEKSRVFISDQTRRRLSDQIEEQGRTPLAPPAPMLRKIEKQREEYLQFPKS